MNIFEAISLGALQGVAEFLPISSSGHLVIGEQLFNLDVVNLKSFDVMVHMGTLLAVFVYFRTDVWGLIKAFFGFFMGKFKGDYQDKVRYIVVATIPAVILGFWGGDWIDKMFRSPASVAMFMLVVAALFFVAEFIYKGAKKHELNFKNTILIGLFQAIALIPGVSRSGSTISAGILSGIDREEAARFSFLLGIPAIAGAGLLTTLELVKGDTGGEGLSLLVLTAGFISAFVFGMLSVAFLMKFLKTHTLRPFAIYLIIISIATFVLFS